MHMPYCINNSAVEFLFCVALLCAGPWELNMQGNRVF